MKSVWAAHAWRVGLSWWEFRRDLRRLAADMVRVGWCQLRRLHYLEPDPWGGAKAHEVCERCWWCPQCRERRTDLATRNAETWEPGL
jgi:hypothetical protein